MKNDYLHSEEIMNNQSAICCKYQSNKRFFAMVFLITILPNFGLSLSDFLFENQTLEGFLKFFVFLAILILDLMYIKFFQNRTLSILKDVLYVPTFNPFIKFKKIDLKKVKDIDLNKNLIKIKTDKYDVLLNCNKFNDDDRNKFIKVLTPYLKKSRV